MLITQYNSLRKKINEIDHDNKNESKNLIESDTMDKLISCYMFDVLPDSTLKKFFEDKEDKKILANKKTDQFKKIINLYGNRISKEKYDKMFQGFDTKNLYSLTRNIVSEVIKQTKQPEKKNEESNICFMLPNINLFKGEYVDKFTSFVLDKNTFESLSKYGNGELLRTVIASFDGIKSSNISKELFDKLSNCKNHQVLINFVSKLDRNFLHDLYIAKSDILVNAFSFFCSTLGMFKKDIEKLQAKEKKEDLEKQYGEFVSTLCGFLEKADDDIFLGEKTWLPALDVFMTVVLFNYECYITLRDKFRKLIFDNTKENGKIGQVIVKVCDMLKGEYEKNEKQKWQPMNKDTLDELSENINVLENIGARIKNEMEEEGLNISDVLNMLKEMMTIIKNGSAKEKEVIADMDLNVKTFNKLSELIRDIGKLLDKVNTADEGIAKLLSNISDILQKEKDKIKLQSIDPNFLDTAEKTIKSVLVEYYNKAMDEDARKVSANKRITDTKIITKIVDYLSTNGDLLTKDVTGNMFNQRNITGLCCGDIINKFVSDVSRFEINRDIEMFDTYSDEVKIGMLDRYYRSTARLHEKCLILSSSLSSADLGRYVYWTHDCVEKSLFDTYREIVFMFHDFLIKYNGINRSDYIPKIINMVAHINFIQYVYKLKSTNINIEGFEEKNIRRTLEADMKTTINALGEENCEVYFDLEPTGRIQSYTKTPSLQILNFGSNNSNYINIGMDLKGKRNCEELNCAWKNFGGMDGYFKNQIYRCDTDVR